MALWQRATKGRKCPICNGDSRCAMHAEGWCKCMRAGPGAVPHTPGWEYERAITKAGTGADVAFKWLPPGGAVRSMSLEAKAEAEKEDHAYTVWTVEQATRIWHSAAQGDRDGKGANHPRLWRYLESRKLPLDRLPTDGQGVARLPSVLRFAAQCYHSGSREKGTRKVWPAMIAAYEHGMPELKARANAAGERFVAIHRTFLSKTGAGNTKNDPQGPGGPERQALGRAIIPNWSAPIVLSDNYRSGVLIVGEGIETTLAGWLTRPEQAAAWSMRDAGHLIEMPLREHLFDARSATAIHTVILLEDLDASGTGQRACQAAEYRIKKAAPHVTVHIAKMTPEDFPTLVERDADGQVWPIGDSKGADWNDAWKVAEAEVVEAALWRGVNLEANSARVAAAATDPSLAGQLLTDEASTEQLAGSGGGSDEPPEGGAPVGADGPDGEDGQNRPPDGPGERRAVHCIPTAPRGQAEAYLRSCEAPPTDRNECCTLTWWKENWWEWDGRAWVAVGADKVFGRVQWWLSTRVVATRSGYVPASTNVEAVTNVVRSLRGILTNEMEQMPGTLPAVYDEHGVVNFSAAVLRRGAMPGGDMSMAAFKNGLLDLAELERGRLVLRPHSPRWFNAAVREHELPISDELIEAIVADHAGDPHQLAALIERHAPNWLKFLRGCADEDDAWCEGLQEVAGQALSGRRLVQKIPLVSGPPRSGKGTIQAVFEAVIGTRNVISTSFSLLTQRFHLSSWVGKSLAIMPDAEVSRMVDATVAVETLKMISGNDCIQIEWKNVKDFANMRLPATVMIFSNTTPNLRDSSNALAGRLVFFPMVKSYLGREDYGLQARLLAEVEWITVWALAGYMRLCRRISAGAGMTEPMVSAERREAFERMSSPLRTFLDDHCDITTVETDLVWIDDLFAAWCRWCELNGNLPGSKERFAMGIYDLHPEVRVPATAGDPKKTGRKRIERVGASGQSESANVRVFRRMRIETFPQGTKRPEWHGEMVRSAKPQQQWFNQDRTPPAKPEPSADDAPF